jgi:hypothetical protein
MRASRASLPSLMAISAAFFLPFIKGCDKMVSGVGLVSEGSSRAFAVAWILPRFGVAALLFALTSWALWRARPPGRASVIAAVVGLLAMLPASVIDGYDLLRRSVGITPRTLTAGVVIFGLGGLGLWWAGTALRRREWLRWERLIAAYAALAAPFAWLAADAFAFGWRDVGVGGYAYLAAIVTLLTLSAASWRMQCRFRA